MKKTLLTLLVLSSSLLAFSQGSWSPRASLPYPDSGMVQGIPGFSIGNYGYAGLGDTYYAGNPSPDLWQFDPSTDSWAKKADFPGKARVAPACFVIGNYAYVVCGSVKNSGTCVNECWQYNANTDTWAQKANFPGGARTYAVGFAIDSLGYVGTGANELQNFYKDFYAYHPSTNMWTRIADFGGIARDADCGFAVNGKGYVCFGQDSLFGGAWLNNDMWEYDPIKNVWTRKADSPGWPSYSNIGFVICSNIYVGSGLDSVGGATRTFWKYATTTDSWTQVASVPGSIRIQGAAFSVGDTGYYGFGAAWDSGSIDLNIFDEFYGGDSCNIDAGVNTTINDLQNISAFPTPFNNYTNIEIANTTTQNLKITCYDLYGQEVKVQCDVSHVNNSTEIKLYKGKLPNGMYIVRIYNGTNESSVKIIVD